MVLFPDQLQNASWILVFTAAGWYLHIHLTDVRPVLILSSNSQQENDFPKLISLRLLSQMLL